MRREGVLITLYNWDRGKQCSIRCYCLRIPWHTSLPCSTPDRSNVVFVVTACKYLSNNLIQGASVAQSVGALSRESLTNVVAVYSSSSAVSEKVSSNMRMIVGFRLAMHSFLPP